MKFKFKFQLSEIKNNGLVYALLSSNSDLSGLHQIMRAPADCHYNVVYEEFGFSIVELNESELQLSLGGLIYYGGESV